MYVHLDPSRPRSRRAVARGFAIAATLVVVAACGDDTSAPPTTPYVPLRVTVTSELGSDESALLAEIYAQALEINGFRVARKNPIGDSEALYDAVDDDRVQFVPAYTADLLASVLATTGGEAPEATSPVQQQEAIAAALPANLTVGTASLALHNDVIACSAAAVETHKLTTIANLAPVAGQITIGAAEGFETSTPLGLATLNETYSVEFEAYVPLTAEAMDDAVKDSEVDCIAVDSMSPTITAQNMTILEDDRSLVPSRAVIPLLTTAIATPELLIVVEAVNDVLTTIALNQMMNEINTNGTSPDVVAKAFLQSLG